MCEYTVGSGRKTKVLVMFYNLLTKNSYPKRKGKILDVMLNKGKGMAFDKLRAITLIKADVQCITRICLNNEEEEVIEMNERPSK